MPAIGVECRLRRPGVLRDRYRRPGTLHHAGGDQRGGAGGEAAQQ
ncbi:hypothetical protein [Streptomyces sp. Wb2n-11]|nr:hypothetical protein [Streptomyces sp. Wb2n-11]